MKIGVDIDGVLVDFPNAIVDAVNSLAFTKIKYDDVTSWSFWDKHENFIFNQLIRDKKFMTTIPFIPGAIKFIADLNYMKHWIYIVSSREYCIRSATRKWMFDIFPYGIVDVIFAKKKYDAAKIFSMDCFVEDNPLTALDLSSKGIKCFLMEYPYNKQLKNLKDYKKFPNIDIIKNHTYKNLRRAFYKYNPYEFDTFKD